MKLSGPIELIKKSIEVFFKKENLVYFLKIYSLLIPFSLFSLFQDNFIAWQSKTLNTGDPISVVSRYPWFLALVIVVNLIYFFVSFLVGVAGIKAIAGVLENKLKSVKEIYLYGWKNLWVFSLLSVLVFLTVFGGTILLIIPGIVFAIWFSFSKLVFVNEKLGIVDSMKKSRGLVKGRFWAVMGRLIVFGVFSGLAGFVISTVPYVGGIISALSRALFILPLFLLYKELSVKPSA